MSVAYPLFAAFRYSVVSNGRGLSLSGLRWDGRDLVLFRPIQRGKLPLFAEVQEIGNYFTVRLHDKHDQVMGIAPVVVEWDVAFDRAENMGFLSLEATDDSPAHEAVRLADARVTAVPALSRSGLDSVRDARADGEGAPPA